MSDFGYTGSARPGEGAGEFNLQSFIIQQMVNRVATSTLVRIVSVTQAGTLDPVGFVDVQPLVNQVDGNGEPTPHGVIHNVPYFRLQGGANAVIIDPVAGDIGMASFASHDLSKVKATKAQANPGSKRRYDMADGLYIGGMLNGAPSQYIRFSGDGIEIVSPTAISLVSPALTHNGANIGATHVHGGVIPGGGSTGTPS